MFEKNIIIAEAFERVLVRLFSCDLAPLGTIDTLTRMAADMVNVLRIPLL